MAFLLNLATGWLLFSALTVCIGAAVGRWTVLPTGDDSGQRDPTLEVEAAHLGRLGGLALILALGLALLRQLLEFRDPYAPWADDLRLLVGSTSWGATWLAATALAILASAGFWLASRGRRALWAP